MDGRSCTGFLPTNGRAAKPGWGFQSVTRLENRFFLAGKPGSHALKGFRDWTFEMY
jgi:hypothetical protein